jgi:hypothetical protein
MFGWAVFLLAIVCSLQNQKDNSQIPASKTGQVPSLQLLSRTWLQQALDVKKWKVSEDVHMHTRTFWRKPL